MSDPQSNKPSKGGLTYREAGVDIDAGDELVKQIKPLARATRRAEVISDVGGFAGLFAVPERYRNPVLVSGADGVGTKVMIAFATGIHSTVGIDLVAMCANDVATCGAEVLFFLDYLATGKLEPHVAREVIAGVAEGCGQAGCALLGGETAEMPGMYGEGEYDLSGFAVGVVEREGILDGKSAAPGDAVLGVASSGIHSNGFSLARRVFFDVLKLSVSDSHPDLERTVGEELLTPTCIYVKGIQAAVKVGGVRSFAHITGGGLFDNPPRVLREGLGMCLNTRVWTVPSIFKVIASAGVEPAEMYRTFNMGIGLTAVVSSDRADDVAAAFKQEGHTVWKIGEVVEAEDIEEGRPRVELKGL